MPHRIGKREAIGDALWRLLADDVARARKTLSGKAPAERRVHRVRQRLKRARSLLVVLKPVIGDAAGDLKESLSGAARLLAGARDADAAAESARGLRAVVAAGDTASLDRIVADLDQKAEEAHSRATPLGEVVRRLSAIEADIAALAGDTRGAPLFDRAIAKFYGDGRKTMHRARSSLSTPDLHRWRKDVKNLWHLIRLGRKRLPGKTAAIGADLARLGDLLGRDHDHAMLAERLALSPHADHALMGQLTIIAGKRRRLEADAFRLGERAYARKPKAFARALRLH